MEKNTWFHLGRNSCEADPYLPEAYRRPLRGARGQQFRAAEKEQVKEYIPIRDTVLFLLRRTEKILQTDSHDEVDEVRRGRGTEGLS